MSGGRNGAHIGSDLGDDGLDRNPPEPWHFVQPFDGIAKGRECGLYAGVEGGYALLQLLDCPQMLGKKEAMVLTDPAPQRLAQGRPSTEEPLAAERCELPGVRFACDYPRKIRRPLGPKISVMTDDSFTFASSKTA